MCWRFLKLSANLGLIFRTRTSADTPASGGIRHVNQTNVALKGILGIRAMGELARIHGENDSADFYSVSIFRGLSIASSLTRLTWIVKGEGLHNTMEGAGRILPTKWLAIYI